MHKRERSVRYSCGQFFYIGRLIYPKERIFNFSKSAKKSVVSGIFIAKIAMNWKKSTIFYFYEQNSLQFHRVNRPLFLRQYRDYIGKWKSSNEHLIFSRFFRGRKQKRKSLRFCILMWYNVNGIRLSSEYIYYYIKSGDCFSRFLLLCDFVMALKWITISNKVTNSAV